MSFLKKEVKRIGYLAKPLQPPSSLYETTYTPPQVIPRVAPLKKRMRMTKSPTEYFYDEPYNELMKKMEKEEAQQQIESSMRLLSEEQRDQEMSRIMTEQLQKYEEMIKNNPDYADKFNRWVEERREELRDKDVALAKAHMREIAKTLKEDKERLLRENRWLDLSEEEGDRTEQVKDVIASSHLLTDSQKKELLNGTKTPEELVAYALTLKATPIMLAHNDIHVLTDLLRDKLEIPFDRTESQFHQAREVLYNTFGIPFRDFQDFRTTMKAERSDIRRMERRARRAKRAKKRQ